MAGQATAQPPQPAAFGLIGSTGKIVSLGKSILFSAYVS